MKGFVNSIETLGALDGPGLRTVVFLQGCHLRCKFCHNIDSTTPNIGTQYGAKELVKIVLQNKPYWEHYKNDRQTELSEISDSEVLGGVTISGGDPMFQPEFSLEIVKLLKKNGVHVALETSLFADTSIIQKFIPFVDLWIISIKEMDEKKHKDLTGVSNKKILHSLDYLDANIKKGSKIRIRFVVIPKISTNKSLIKKLGKRVSQIKNLEKLELLPYVTIGKDKWIKLYKVYHLEGVREANLNDIDIVKSILSEHHIKVF